MRYRVNLKAIVECEIEADGTADVKEKAFALARSKLGGEIISCDWNFAQPLRDDGTPYYKDRLDEDEVRYTHASPPETSS